MSGVLKPYNTAINRYSIHEIVLMKDSILISKN